MSGNSVDTRTETVFTQAMTNDPTQTDAYWNGRLSAAIELMLDRPDEPTCRSSAAEALAEYRHWARGSYSSVVRTLRAATEGAKK